MIFLLFITSILTSISSLSKLSHKDLESKDPILIYIYYQKITLNCPVCILYHSYISQLDPPPIPIKILNYFEDPLLAGKFLVILTPALIIYDHKRAHHVSYDLSFKQITEILRSKSWEHLECMKWINNPGNYVVRFYSRVSWVYFKCYAQLYFVAVKIPPVVVSIFFGVMMSFVVIILVQVVREILQSKKEKLD